MQNFVVSARKYRPTTFDTVVGQSSITTTLKNAIRNNHVAQAYLFCGPRGVGKTTIARIFAKTINCQNLGEDLQPCDECESCKAFNQHRSTNIHELDAASNNTVDNIRSLIDQVRIPPQLGKYSIYIIDEVHMLSASAFNAFLKTLEEPPPHAIFILATTEKHKIIPTILSRCQIFDFNRIKVEEMVQFLERISQKEGVQYERDALTIIAQKADGAMRDALSIYDQVVSFSDDQITYPKVIENLNVLDFDYYFRLTDAFMEGNHAEALVIFNEILEKGFDAHQFINGLSKHFRDLLITKDEKTLELLEVGAGIREKYKDQSSRASVDFLIRALNVVNQYDVSYRTSMNQRLHVELAMIDLCNLDSAKKKAPEERESGGEVEKKDVTEGKKSEKIKESLNKKAQKTQPSEESHQSQQPVSFSINSALKKDKGSHTETGETQTKSSEQQDAEAKSTSQSPDQTVEEGEALNQSDLEKAWQEFAESYREKPRIYNMLLSRKPTLDEDLNVKFYLENELQKAQLERIYNELLFYLKKELGNNSIHIQAELIKEDHDTSSRKLYTDEEKYSHLEKKNQNLRKLRQDFDLDFD
ncbi:MAG: DNA polymerase III subunit gamma/tau [Bacteroidales bacterium]|nr:DNA polymerase III subunit gamma/tau [Bacteroidales bacterium]MBS3774892.1 DNA polymerase III subunit gamma/tau [Bacteroidales bacterium]